MKENRRLHSAASFIEDELFTKTKDNQIDLPSVMASSSIKPTAGFIQEGSSARYLTFKLCSYCPYKNEFYETLEHICGSKKLE